MRILSLGARIQQYRKSNKLSQEQLGEIAGVSRQAVSKWESGQTAPEIDKVRILCKQFSITLDELLDQPVSVEEVAAESKDDIAEDAAPPEIAETAVEKPEENVTVNPHLTAALLKVQTKKRQFTMGWVTALIGVILMLIEYFSLFVVQYFDFRIAATSSSRWYSNALHYATVPPMPLIFNVTKIVIIVGILVAINGFFGMRVPTKYNQVK